MHKLLYLFIGIPTLLSSQKQQITLEEIWKGTFREEYLQSYQPMNNNKYSLLGVNYATKSTAIDVYDYATLEKTETIIDSKNLNDIAYFDDYSFNDNETKILLSTNSESIYRHSTQAIYYVYDRAAKKTVLVDKAPIQEPTFSNDSKRIAYVKGNNMFIKDLESNTTTPITTDGKINFTINGIADWVYEEEFSYVKAFAWSTNSDKIAYLKFDESEVPFFSMDIVGNELYPSQHTFKYPKAGEKNSKVTLHIYDLNSKTTETVALGDYEYIPHITWTSENDKLAVVTLNRLQNHLTLFSVDTKDNSTAILLEEKDAAYVDVININNLTFLKDNSFIWQSEKDGFNHLYHYNASGKLKKQITKGSWEVTKFYGINTKSKTLFYQSAEDGSTNRTIYKIGLNGKYKKRLSAASGTNDADFSKDKNYFILNHSDAKTPTSYHLYSAKKHLKEITNNDILLEKLSNYQLSEKVFSEIKTQNGSFNMWMLKPADFNPEKKYPLLMVQYSGPGSQEVANTWHSYNDYWFQYLAQKGYVIACVDGRGTGYKGAAFKKVTYKELGKYETIDQIEVAKELGKLPYINTDKIGIWGWSFGGFMATNCLLKGNDVFNTAIAVAPVTSWRFYDTVYTERYMGIPQDNPSGYDDNSPLFHAEKLKGNYLIVHGTGDDNVHVQNAYQMTNALIRENKPFDQAIYPDRAHGIYRGQNTRLHLFTKMSKFLDQHLK